MANLNIVGISGRLTKDVELRTTSTGTEVANATLAVNGYKEDDTSFFDVVFFGKAAEVVSKYSGKGQLLTVSGRLQQRSWEKDGQKRSVVEIVASEVQLPPKGEAQGQPKDVVLEDIDDKRIDLSDVDIPF